MSESFPHQTPRPLLPTPVVLEALDQLVAQTDALAKAWLLQLIDSLPLQDVGRVSTADMATVGPRLCAAFLCAIGSEKELNKLAQGGELSSLVAELPVAAGARTAQEIFRAVDSLRATIWTVVARDLVAVGDAQLVALCSERISRIAAVLCQAISIEPDFILSAQTVSGQLAGSFSSPSGSRLLRTLQTAMNRSNNVALALIQIAGYRDLERALSGAKLKELTETVHNTLGLVLPDQISLFPLVGGSFAVVSEKLAPGAMMAQLGAVSKAVADLPAEHGTKLQTLFVVAVSPQDGTTPDLLLESAQSRLIEAEASGRRTIYPATFGPDIPVL